MAGGGWFKVTITEQDYRYTRYTTWVRASSKVQAIAKGAALAGQEKMRVEHERTGHDIWPEGLLEPEVKLAPVSVDEYYANQNKIVVSH